MTEKNRLTVQQQRLLELLSRGLTVGEAAEALNTSRRTAERRLADARRKIGAETSAEAVARTCCGDAPPTVVLTPRERQILGAVAAGQRDAAIAEELDIAPSTVAALLRSAMAKLGVRSRVAAVARLAGFKDDA